MKKIIICFLVIVLFSFNVKAVDEESITVDIYNDNYVTGKVGGFTCRSIENNDVSVISGFMEKCDFKKSFPCNMSKYLNSWIELRQYGIPYSALVIERKGIPVAALGLGWMDISNLDPRFKGIINAYVDLGVIRFVRNEKHTKVVNIERVGNQGVAALLPIMPPSLGNEEIKDILRIGVKVLQFLKETGCMLPLERTIPAYVIGLFYPTDPLISHLRDVGFGILSKPDFRGYYGEPCVMAYFKL